MEDGRLVRDGRDRDAAGERRAVHGDAEVVALGDLLAQIGGIAAGDEDPALVEQADRVHVRVGRCHARERLAHDRHFGRYGLCADGAPHLGEPREHLQIADALRVPAVDRVDHHQAVGLDRGLRLLAQPGRRLEVSLHGQGGSQRSGKRDAESDNLGSEIEPHLLRSIAWLVRLRKIRERLDAAMQR